MAGMGSAGLDKADRGAAGTARRVRVSRDRARHDRDWRRRHGGSGLADPSLDEALQASRGKTSRAGAGPGIAGRA